MFDVLEFLKRGRRLLDGNYSPRKMMLVVLLVLVLLLYTGPYILRLLFSSSSPSIFMESASHSVASRVNNFKSSLSSMDAHVLFTHPPEPHPVLQDQQDPDEAVSSLPRQQFIPYVGNGYIGVWVRDDAAVPSSAVGGSALHIRQGRHLAMPLPYEPLVSVHVDGGTLHEAVVTHYPTATVHRVQAWELPSLAANHRTAAADGQELSPADKAVDTEGLEGSVEVTHKVYAHRTIPSLLLQDVVVINPNPVSVFVRVQRPGEKKWSHVTTETFTVDNTQADGGPPLQYTVVTGTVPAPALFQHRHRQASKSVLVVAVATLQLPAILQVNARMATSLHVLTAVNYSEPVTQQRVTQTTLQVKAAVIQTIRSAVSGSLSSLTAAHSAGWGALWRSGLHLVTSRAEGAINGDLINATLYNVLSHVRAPLQEVATPSATWDQLATRLSPAASEGCYQGHHTLQAEKLWSPLSTTEDVSRVVSAWLITLEKQGCHELVKAGADGVLQAMLLSFGGLCFRNQHLEYNTQAVDLHRDLTFRHLRYGLGVSLNLSVEVQDHDYKPVLWVSLLQQRVPSDGAADTAGNGPAVDIHPIGENKSSEPDMKQDPLVVDKVGSAASPLSPGDVHIHPKYVRLLHAVASTQVAADQEGNSSNQDQPHDKDPINKNAAKTAVDAKSGSAVNKKTGTELQSYYACDAGCLDPPVELGSTALQFPVKLTEPVTAILYITSDREHMEELKHSIHVREVALAPGHHQSVIALHRHGHKWGRLPPLFWLTIAILVVTFHLFLFKLVVNEYCSGDSRTRYRKLSDF